MTFTHLCIFPIYSTVERFVHVWLLTTYSYTFMEKHNWRVHTIRGLDETIQMRSHDLYCHGETNKYPAIYLQTCIYHLDVYGLWDDANVWSQLLAHFHGEINKYNVARRFSTNLKCIYHLAVYGLFWTIQMCAHGYYPISWRKNSTSFFYKRLDVCGLGRFKCVLTVLPYFHGEINTYLPPFLCWNMGRQWDRQLRQRPRPLATQKI